LDSPLPISSSPSSSSSFNDTSPNNPPPSIRLNHITLKFASLNDLAHMYHAAKAGGVEPHLCLNHGVTASLYYKLQGSKWEPD
ncbi:glyoxalase/Bleomycin resistance protein/Dioxygenase superfamily protein, partial [Colletotrichum costaricense]